LDVGTQWSADGQWWWDGQKWHTAASLRRPDVTVQEVAPSPFLLTFGAFACLGLALLTYVLLPTHLLALAPVTSIIAINVGHATRKMLPKTAVRDRTVAAVGIALSALPLALIMLGIIVIEFLVGFSIIFGHQ
jgi:hypothetical protein